MDYPQNDDPNHLGLWCNVLPGHQMALITSVVLAEQAKSALVHCR